MHLCEETGGRYETIKVPIFYRNIKLSLERFKLKIPLVFQILKFYKYGYFLIYEE